LLFVKFECSIVQLSFHINWKNLHKVGRKLWFRMINQQAFVFDRLVFFA